MSTAYIAGIAVEKATYDFDKIYDYILPPVLANKTMPGCRVMVPFGKASVKRQGIIISIKASENTEKLKPVYSVIDESPLLNKEMLDLAIWLKKRTFCTLFEAVKAILPAGIMHKTVISYALTPNADKSKMSDDEIGVYNSLLNSKGYIEEQKLLIKNGLSHDSNILKSMLKKGWLSTNVDAVRRMNDLTVRMVRLTQSGREANDSGLKLSKKQAEIIKLLSEIGSASIKEVCYYTGFTPVVVTTLKNKGLIDIFEDVSNISQASDDDLIGSDNKKIVLTDEQQKAYDNLLNQYYNGTGSASLLYGVTGSGKTLVYMKLIDKMLEMKKSVIVMVPEIALTPQTLNLFQMRYGKKIAVFHSALSMRQRTEEWKKVKNGEAEIAIGTRSAVFAPFNNLGLIIVDEEQEHTYKSEQSPRYDARDVAKFRCAKHKALTLFASATPSIETYASAKKGKYTLNVIKERYGNAQLPNVRIIDMCAPQNKLEQSNEISSELYEALKQNLLLKKQSILLINRRGYNTFAACRSCGYVITCPSCSISMTYHHANGRLMCHYCGYSQPFTTKCPECGSDNMRYSGFGTQKIEDELAALLPDARVLRMDADTTMARFAHDKKLKSFAENEYDILLGTQMVAKGLDFENVTLVGVVSADMQLNNDDFRSQERTFDLLTQVVGRSGRGQYKGTAIIQTIAPENEIIKLSAQQNYEDFFKMEIELRKMLIYPPFCDICLFGFSGTDEPKVKGASQQFFKILKKIISKKYKSVSIIALGPMASRVKKVSNKFRYRLILKCKNNKAFRDMADEVLLEFSKQTLFKNVSVYIDINPENIL